MHSTRVRGSEPARICAAVAAATGTLQAAGLGRRLEGPRRGGDGRTNTRGFWNHIRVLKQGLTNGLVLLSLLEWVFVK